MKFNQQILLLFIDAYVDEYGCMSYPVMKYHFSVSRSTFTKLIAEYLQDRPSMLKFDTSSHTYHRGAFFERHYNARTPSLDILEAYTVLMHRRVLTLRAIRDLEGATEQHSLVNEFSDYSLS